MHLISLVYWNEGKRQREHLHVFEEEKESTLSPEKSKCEHADGEWSNDCSGFFSYGEDMKCYDKGGYMKSESISDGTQTLNLI